MEILGKLFSTPARVKVMRLFLLNPDKGFDVGSIAAHSRVPKSAARKEITLLLSIDFLAPKKIERTIGKRKKKLQGFILNPEFKYIRQVKELLVDAEFLGNDELLKRFKKAGKIKLFVVAGIFIRRDESRVDFMLVADNLKRPVLDRLIRTLEAEIGKDLVYAVFDSEEFKYRLGMYDKLVRDVLDFPHETILDSGTFTLSDPARQSTVVPKEALSTRA